jgi:hypothetical protein
MNISVRIGMDTSKSVLLSAIWREADSDETDRETVLSDQLSGQYRNPARVIAFNVSEGW